MELVQQIDRSERPYVPESCSEETRLRHEYRAAVSDFRRIVEFLNARIGVISKAEYERLRRSAEQARLRSERARNELEQHLDRHSGCSAA